ncbi:MAG: hypothetical protein ACYDAI_03600 [Trichloromonadaceae bacterium]
MDPVRHRKFSLVPLTAVIALGSAGHTLFEGWGAGYAAMSAATLITLGFKQVYDLSHDGAARSNMLVCPGQAFTCGNPERIAAGAAHV